MHINTDADSRQVLRMHLACFKHIPIRIEKRKIRNSMVGDDLAYLNIALLECGMYLLRIQNSEDRIGSRFAIDLNF